MTRPKHPRQNAQDFPVRPAFRAKRHHKHAPHKQPPPNDSSPAESRTQFTPVSPMEPPQGAHLDLNSGVDPAKPIMLSEKERKYTLQNRDEAMKLTEKTFVRVFEGLEERIATRTCFKIPVCAAMSGIGKTRLLDEMVMRFNSEEYSLRDCENFPVRERRMALVLSYGNGHASLKAERSMGSVAAFAWRLLHGVFLDNNEARGWSWDQFWKKLPSNACELTLGLALDVVETILSPNGERCALFVGIDEFQKIPHNHVDTENGPLASLLDALNSAMTGGGRPLVLLPMFAGTDWKKFSLAASAPSGQVTSSSESVRLLMPLLDQKAIREAVLGRGSGVEKLLENEVFCKFLFYLGGVPRPCTQYAEVCYEWNAEEGQTVPGRASKRYEEIFQDKFNEFFTECYNKAPAKETAKKTAKTEDQPSFTLRELIRLAAFAVCGDPVKEEDRPFEDLNGSLNRHIKFRRLRDGSVCVLEREWLQLPYCFFYHLSSDERIYRERMQAGLTEAEDAFLDVLAYLKKHVDHNVFSPTNAPWQQWEMFGACFTALRINAILITTSVEEHKLTRLFRGANGNFQDRVVRLLPTRVIQTEEKFSRSTPVLIKAKNDVRSINWMTEGVVVLNGESGAGIDIFYTLELVDSPGKYVFVGDQRKRRHGSPEIGSAFQKASGIRPNQEGIDHVIMAVFSMFTHDGDDIPENSVSITLDQHERYHGSLHQHPAASVGVRVNVDGLTALRDLFENRAKPGADKLLQERNNKEIKSFEELKDRLGDLKDSLSPNAESQCIFSS